MYVPDHFKAENPDDLHAMIRRHSFATLVTGGAPLTASHLPFHLDDTAGESGTLLSHMARANPQWKEFADCGEALVVFQGPHAYISPSMYTSPNLVPTWNYSVVHAYGLPVIVGDDELREILTIATDDYEGGRENAWSLQSLSPSLISNMMKAIVGFRIEITRIEGKDKMSQNRSRVDQVSAIEALLESGDASERAVALHMWANLDQ